MCYGCWEEEGCPIDRSPDVLEVAKMARERCPSRNLHIVLDDWNVDDEHLDWCEAYLNEHPIENRSEDIACDREVLWALRRLSYKQRIAALAWANRYWS